MNLGFWSGWGKPLGSGFMNSGGANSWQNELLSMFSAGDDVGIQYNFVGGSSAASYYMYKHLVNNKYWRIKFAGGNVSVGQNSGVLGVQAFCDLYKGYNDQTTPALVFSAGWTKTGNENYVGGRLAFESTAGRYLEITTNSTSFGIVFTASQTGVGVAKITIDGDATLADLLPTAQDLVDSGVLASTVLVSNGGTLDPTDRVLDEYNGSVDNNEHGGNATVKYFTTSLSEGSHACRVTVTGYKNQSSSGTTIHVMEMLSTSPSTRSSNNGNDFLVSSAVIDVGNTLEISYFFRPTGTSSSAWLGHEGQSKVATSPALSVDGVSVTPVDETSYAGSTIVITQTSSIRHPQVGGGATNLGTYSSTITLDKATGLTVAHSVSWAVAGVAVGYPCMMPVSHNLFDRFKTYGQAEVDLTDADNSVKLSTTEQAIWCWDFDGNAAALMYINNLELTVENWSKSTAKLWWQDSNPGTVWKKAYATRFTNDESFINGTTWQSEANYRVHWFSEGANTALSGKF